MEEKSNAILTETLADLYLKNGMKERARRIYKMLLKADPANERIREKLLLLNSPSDGTPEAAHGELEERINPDREDCGEREILDGRSGAAPESLSFDRLNEMYRKMARQKNEKKIRMLKMMLESLTR